MVKKNEQNPTPLKLRGTNDKLLVRGARTHNLKNITVEMPRNKMVVFTGLSGSGKSSLAFDTIFAEGQRRHVESLSSYARQFLRQMQKPDVDEIVGLSPAISIDQKSRSNNPRSTVATITEIYDYLRVLYSRIGRPHCLVCGDEIKKLSNTEIKNFIIDKLQVEKRKLKSLEKKEKNIEFPKYLELFAPVVRGRKGEYYQLLYDMLGRGYIEAVIDGKRQSLRERIELTKTKRHDISVLVDSININDFETDKKNAEERLSESLEKALEEANGLVEISFRDLQSENLPNSAKASLDDEPKRFIMSNKFACPKDGYSYPEIEPRLFSFGKFGVVQEFKSLLNRHGDKVYYIRF